MLTIKIMFPILALLTSLCAISMILAGAAVLLRSPNKRQNQLFFSLSLVLGLWVPCNFIGSNVIHPVATHIFVNLDFSLGLLIGWAMLYFLSFFPQKSTKTLVTSSRAFLIITALLNTLLIGSTFLGVNIRVSVLSGELKIENGPIYPIYVLVIIYYILFAFKNLIKTYRHSKKPDRHALNLVFLGFAAAALGTILSNIVFPELFSQRQTIQALNIVGYIGVSILVLSLYIAITTRKLFDIKLVIARSLAYVFSISVLAGGYSLITYTLTNILTAETGGISLLKTSLSVTLITAMLVTYGPIKKFFDKTTNQIFYRDAYDPQMFFDELNNVLVSNIELNKLLVGTIKVLGNNLKSSYTVFTIRETSYFSRRVVGDPLRHISKEEAEEITKLTNHMRQKIVVADYLEDDNSDLKKVLSKNDIAVLVKLVATLDIEAEGVGYISLGPKKSGNPYNKQDIQTLDIIANELVIAIQNALRFEEIEKFNITLQEKIEIATHQLRRTNEKLKALDETKDEFISMASHQLRTPLTSVKGYLSMVLEGDAGKVSQMQHKLLDQAFVSSQRMVYLIADLLNVSRLRTGKFVIEPVATNLADVIEGEVGQLQDTAASRGVKLTYSKPQAFPTLMLDETKIRQVIMNFMDNAIYYTPAKGHITVELKETDKMIEYTVHDDGIGVPKHEQHHLFTKFYRAGNAKKARPDGTGLGLFMAKKVIVVQGGSIIFSSEEGKGSTFGFAFEKAKLQAPKAPETPTKT